jgi:predicted transcriptional regulator
VPQPAIARIEAGRLSPRIDTLSRVIEAAGYSLELTVRLGDGVDRTLIRESLSSAPEDRIRAAGRAGRNLARLLEEVGDGRSR